MRIFFKWSCGQLLFSSFRCFKSTWTSKPALTEWHRGILYVSFGLIQQQFLKRSHFKYAQMLHFIKLNENINEKKRAKLVRNSVRRITTKVYKVIYKYIIKKTRRRTVQTKTVESKKAEKVWKLHCEDYVMNKAWKWIQSLGKK